jgi:TIR domain
MARIIISYCHADQHLVRPFTKLLGGALSEHDQAVYWDDRFESGQSWTEQFVRALGQSDKLFVFWCDHSAASKAVQKEVEIARALTLLCQVDQRALAA